MESYMNSPGEVYTTIFNPLKSKTKHPLAVRLV